MKGLCLVLHGGLGGQHQAHAFNCFSIKAIILFHLDRESGKWKSFAFYVFFFWSLSHPPNHPCQGVQTNDQIMLIPDGDDCRYLHASQPADGSRELNCAFHASAWTIQLYDNCHLEPTVCLSVAPDGCRSRQLLFCKSLCKQSLELIFSLLFLACPVGSRFCFCRVADLFYYS